jgi:hypothetical protein
MFPSICHFLPEARRGGALPPLFYLLPISPLAALLLLLLLLPMCLSSDLISIYLSIYLA